MFFALLVDRFDCFQSRSRYISGYFALTGSQSYLQPSRPYITTPNSTTPGHGDLVRPVSGLKLPLDHEQFLQRGRGFESRQELGFFLFSIFQWCVLNQVPHGPSDFRGKIFA